MEKNSAQLSALKGKTVRGYEVKRLPLGEYLRAIEAVRALPERAMAVCFPGMEAQDVLETLRGIDKNALAGLLFRLLDTMPKEAVGLLSILTGIEEERLLHDPQIGLDGAAEMLEAFFEINGIENFISAAERIAAKIRKHRAGGSKG